MTTRQMQGEAVGISAHPAADLDEAEAERVQTQRGDPCLAEPAPQRVEQPVGGSMEQQAELIGPEAVAAEPIGKAAVLEIIDPLLGRAPLHVPIVEGERSVSAGRDDEAEVGALVQRLGFVDDAPAYQASGRQNWKPMETVEVTDVLAQYVMKTHKSNCRYFS